MGGSREEYLIPAKGLGNRNLEPQSAIVAGTLSERGGSGELGGTWLHMTLLQELRCHSAVR